MQGPITILDGSIGHLLKDQLRSHAETQNLQFDELFAVGAMANAKHPDIIKSVHNAYIEAGAEVITTNSFGCTKFSLGKCDKAHLASELAANAGKLAREAASTSGRDILVAGCLPPLLESYQTSDLYAFEQMQPEYEELVAALAPHVDIFLCETLSTIAEALAACSVASFTGKPWWVSFTIQDNDKALLRSGETLEKAVEAVKDLPGLEAILLNCSAPQAISIALPVLRQDAPSSIRVGAYGNAFKTTTSEWLASKGEGSNSHGSRQLDIKADDYDDNGVITPAAYAKLAKEWVDAGASIIGGCCGIGPEHIQLVCETIKTQRA